MASMSAIRGEAGNRAIDDERQETIGKVKSKRNMMQSLETWKHGAWEYQLWCWDNARPSRKWAMMAENCKMVRRYAACDVHISATRERLQPAPIRTHVSQHWAPRGRGPWTVYSAGASPGLHRAEARGGVRPQSLIHERAGWDDETAGSDF